MLESKKNLVVTAFQKAVHAQTSSQRCFEGMQTIKHRSSLLFYLLNMTDEQSLLLQRCLCVETLISSNWIYSAADSGQVYESMMWFSRMGKLQVAPLSCCDSIWHYRHKDYWVHLYGYLYWLPYFRSTSVCRWSVALASVPGASSHRRDSNAT